MAPPFSAKLTMFSLRQYLDTLNDPFGLTRTLEGFRPVRDAEGRLCYSVGNSAIIFRIEWHGKPMALRCYLRPHRRLAQIYGERLLSQELFLYETATSGRWVDVVLTDWVEGEPLDQLITQAARNHDQTTLKTLSEKFDRLAATLLADDWAHGDLKPENIIYTPNGELQLIDFDAVFLPEMAGEPAIELGTAAYQHPARNRYHFNARTDDYSAALISTALAALALDPALYDRFGSRDGLLIDPKRIPWDEAYDEIRYLFASQGLFVRHALARQLDNFHLSLPDAAALFALLTHHEVPSEGRKVGLYRRENRYGLTLDKRPITPPLFDEAKRLRNGLAEVKLDDCTHRINLEGFGL